MERSDWDDDEDVLPPAPLPVHERSWRHPSEMVDGADRRRAAAARTPRTITAPGRSLAILAGAVGVVVGLGLLRLMLPVGTGGREPVDIASGNVGTLPAQSAFVSSDGDAAPRDSLDTGSPPPAPDGGTNDATGAAPDIAPAPLSGTTGGATSESTVAPVNTHVSAPLPAAPTTVQIAGMSAVAVPLSADGFLVTTAAAVAGRGTVFDLVMANNRRHTAVLVATGADLAILRLDVRPDEMAEGFTPAHLADSDLGLAEGSWVTVFGATASRAVLVTTDGGLALAGIGPDHELLEGAPVVDDAGRVVGLCSRSRGTTNLVLTHTANTMKDQVREQAWLGIAGAPGSAPTPEGREPPRGVLVVDVLDDGPASRAGILPGDDLVRLDGADITSILQLAELVAARPAGDTVTVTVVRLGVEVDIQVELGVRPYAT